MMESEKVATVAWDFNKIAARDPVKSDNVLKVAAAGAVMVTFLHKQGSCLLLPTSRRQFRRVHRSIRRVFQSQVSISIQRSGKTLRHPSLVIRVPLPLLNQKDQVMVAESAVTKALVSAKAMVLELVLVR